MGRQREERESGRSGCEERMEGAEKWGRRERDILTEVDAFGNLASGDGQQHCSSAVVTGSEIVPESH